MNLASNIINDHEDIDTIDDPAIALILQNEDVEGDAVAVAVESQADEKTAEQLAQEEVLNSLMDPQYSWYIVSVYVGMEDSVKLNLLERVKRAGLEDLFKDIVIPKVMVEKVLKSGRKMVPKTSFPGYMFVQVKLTEAAYSTVVCTARISGFLGNHKKPKPMSDKDVLHFLGPNTESQEVDEQKQMNEVFFDIGQSIKVIAGPFANFDGIVEEVKPDKLKLTVRVSILGRETPLELSYDEVQKTN